MNFYSRKMPTTEEWMAWTQWPLDVPRPTQAEWESAFARYEATCDQTAFSDYNYAGLGYVLTFFNIAVWWKFFFPESERFKIVIPPPP